MTSSLMMLLSACGGGSGQVSAITKNINNMTPKQREELVSAYDKLIPEQQAALANKLSHLTPEQLQDLTQAQISRYIQEIATQHKTIMLMALTQMVNMLVLQLWLIK